MKSECLHAHAPSEGEDPFLPHELSVPSILGVPYLVDVSIQSLPLLPHSILPACLCSVFPLTGYQSYWIKVYPNYFFLT